MRHRKTKKIKWLQANHQADELVYLKYLKNDPEWVEGRKVPLDTSPHPH